MGFFDKFKKKEEDEMFKDNLGLENDPLTKGPLTDYEQKSPYEPPPPTTNVNELNNLDYNNPDINQVTGTPKPRNPYEETNNNNYNLSEQQLPNTKKEPEEQKMIMKDLQIIIAKIDAIKSELDSLHQRVQKIERIADAEQKRTRYGQW